MKTCWKRTESENEELQYEPSAKHSIHTDTWAQKKENECLKSQSERMEKKIVELVNKVNYQE